MRLLLLAFIAGLSGNLYVFSTDETQGDLERKIVKHTLSNGMKLVLLERHDAPVISCANVVHVGSVNEEAGYTGLAHMFEHMAFKGTRRIGTKNYEEEAKLLNKIDAVVDQILEEKSKGTEINKTKLEGLQGEFKRLQEEADKHVDSNEFGFLIEKNGGSGFNAFTSSDFTCYLVSMPSNKLELFIALEADRLLNPVLREFYKERDVVKEERRMSVEDQPLGKLVEEALSISFKAHPYGWPTVGHMSDLDSLTRSKAVEFYKKYYVPNNMVLAIVGDIDVKETIKLAEEYFGKIPRGSQPKRVATVEPIQEGERRVDVETTAQPAYGVVYHKPNSFSKDEAVFQCINEILANGRTSRLYKKLVKEQKSALYVGSMSNFPGYEYPNLFVVYSIPTTGHTVEEIEKVIDEEIELLKSQLVTDSELKSAKSRIQVNAIRQIDSTLMFAVQLASTESLTGDWSEMTKGLERIKSVTAEDIKRVATEYFKKSNRSVARLVTKAQTN
ncbi:MAG: insulinase family protein [Planctomycetes bacterium]|nr:insulinase family protein [Planctomycetota bacterium]